MAALIGIFGGNHPRTTAQTQSWEAIAAPSPKTLAPPKAPLLTTDSYANFQASWRNANAQLKALRTQIKTNQDQEKSLQDAATKNNQFYERTTAKATEYANSTDPIDQRWHAFYQRQAKGYQQKSADQRAEANRLADQNKILETQLNTTQQQLREELAQHWPRLSAWLAEDRIPQNDPRLKHTWPRNVQVFSATQQREFSWMNPDGGYATRELLKQSKTQPSLPDALRSIKGYTPVCEDEIQIQHPLASSNPLTGWQKKDNATMAPYRRVLIIMGDGKEGDSSYEPEAFEADILRLREIMVRQYGLPDDDDHFVVVRSTPNSEQALENAFKDMDAFARRAQKAIAQGPNKDLKPECLVVIAGHGFTLETEPGLPEAEAQREGAKVGGIRIRNATNTDPGYLVMETQIKQWANRHLERYGTGILFFESCHSGAFIAKAPKDLPWRT
jgi:hypothetical protein